MTPHHRSRGHETLHRNDASHEGNEPSSEGPPATWADTRARSQQLANVILVAPIGFKGEHPDTSGISHLVEHLIATGSDEGPHFNGFTSDSVISVYGLCSSGEVDEVVSLLTSRAQPTWVRVPHVIREAYSVRNETALHVRRPTKFDHLIADMGLNAGAGELPTRPSLSAVHETMDAVCSRGILAIFDPNRHSEMLWHSLAGAGPAPVATASVNPALRRERTRSESLTVWRFDADTVAHDARFQLAVDFALLDGYLRKRDGSARIAWLDDFRWWGGDTWAVMAVPEATQSLLERNGLHTVGELIDRIRRTNPGLTEHTHTTIAGGPTWIRHPVVREIAREMSSALLTRVVPASVDVNSWIRDTAIVEA